MATYFQSFRSSSMPKRLLRYVLTRLDLLDADALDMENLDMAWGRNSVLEFRDVGIKLQVRLDHGCYSENGRLEADRLLHG
jgi:autophagy-related protein 2